MPWGQIMIRFPGVIVYLVAVILTGMAVAEAPQACLQQNVREVCLQSCAEACRDDKFLGENLTYCLENGLVGAGTLDVADAPECVGLFETSPPGQQTQDASTSHGQIPAQVVDCSEFTKLSERLRCELNTTGPKCSASVEELQGQGRLLDTSIQAQLAQYGELLTKDWSDVNNRELLCAFSLSELDENYEVATQDPHALRAVQRQAISIQACMSEWEDFVRARAEAEAGSGDSDTLADELARDAEERLGPLQGQIENLSLSIGTLEAAADTITSIEKLHLIYCKAEGEPPLATE
jgi:hypothetical protein